MYSKLCTYMSQDNVASYIGHYVIRTCHSVKMYHKGHKRLGCIIGHYSVWIIRHLYKKIHQRFVYLYVTELVI